MLDTSMTRTMVGTAVAACMLCSVRSGAQSADSARMAVSANPTIVLRADVSAREVRFAKQPDIRITLVGGDVDSVRVIERRNLPERIQPGVTYRDVFVAVEVIGKLHAQCLAEAIRAARGGKAGVGTDSAPVCRPVTGAAARRSP